MAFTLYHNPQCSKSRESLIFLQDRGVEFVVVEYLKNPLTADQLRTLISQLEGPLASLVRTKEAEFLAQPFDIHSAAELVAGLLRNPRLMERPILQARSKAVIGRPLTNFEALLSTEVTNP